MKCVKAAAPDATQTQTIRLLSSPQGESLGDQGLLCYTAAQEVASPGLSHWDPLISAAAAEIHRSQDLLSG